MAELRAEPRDLDEGGERGRRSLVAAQASYVVVPVLLAGALWPWSEYLSHLAWLLEPLSVSLDAEGFGLRGSHGETYTRWNDELAVRELRT
jgi:hypothetical protein